MFILLNMKRKWGEYEWTGLRRTQEGGKDKYLESFSGALPKQLELGNLLPAVWLVLVGCMSL